MVITLALGSSRTRRTRKGFRYLGTIAAVGAAALVVSGCGSSSSSSTDVPTVSLSRAANVSLAAPGYKLAATLHETVANKGMVDTSATESFSPASRLGAMSIVMRLPPAARAGPVRFQIVLDRSTVYLKLPPHSGIPGGKPWVYINLDQAGRIAGIPGLGALLNGGSSLADPGQYLSFLRATSVGSVRDLGQANVNGVRTTHYSAEVDLSKVPDVVPGSSRLLIQPLVVALEQKGATTRILVHAWIDSSNLIRRIQVAFSEPLGTGQSMAVSLTANFPEYGPQPAPAVPSAGESTNLLSLGNTSR